MKKLLSIICIITMLIAIAGCSDGRTGKVQKLSKDEAVQEMDALLKKVVVHEGTAQMDVSDVDGPSTLAAELPDIEVHEMVVRGNGAVDVEIMSSPEKATRDSKNDDWLIQVANDFNTQNNGMSVSVRNVASGLATDYIQSGKYIPAAISASNEIWTPVMESNGTKLTKITDSLVPNDAGILINNDTYKKLEEQYTNVDLHTIIEATLAGDIITSYTNPLVSSTGLNLLIAMMKDFDSANPLSETATTKLEEFQNKIPSVAYTTAQMRESAKKGIIDTMVMEYQAYINEKELAKSYTFVPMGVRHDSPLYATDVATDEQVRVLNEFAKFAQQEKYQNLGADKGFIKSDYVGESPDLTAEQVRSIQETWKNKKDAGRPLVAVFVSDTSGSMLGTPLAELKTSLKNAAGYIKDDAYIGLVSYSSDITIEAPIEKFNKQQKALFNGAINDFSADGGTATNDAILVAANMLLEKQKELPNAKLMMFVLSDGEQTDGYSLDKVSDTLIGLGIPIHTIGYGEHIEDLKTISNFNESSHIQASPEDVTYNLKNIFNSQL